ncbi:hypothetical protein FC959_16930 [Clostridium botulinum]|nr:hypothetical protein [Clostridium botulinum]
MEYISAKEFLKQPKEIQKVFIDWWQPRIFDLYHVEFKDEEEIFSKNLSISQEDIDEFGIDFFPNGIDGNVFPLLTEGQLRKFIEDNINKKVDIIHYINEGYILVVDEDIDYSNLGHDLLQAYWKVACQIANKEE